MKTLLSLVVLTASSLFAADSYYGCWSSNQFGGYLVCGTLADPSTHRAATAEEIAQDQAYNQWKASAYEKYGQNMVAHLEESLVGVDPVVAERIRTTWANVQVKTQEKVEVFLDVQKKPNKPTN